MGWLLGFGIPIAYVIIGAFLSRAQFRSRHKRGLRDSYYDREDTNFAAGIMFFCWPAIAPVYFPWVWIEAHKDGPSNMIEAFYKRNLPETNHQKQMRLQREAFEARRQAQEAEQEKTKLQKRIDTLERELEIGPYAKDII